MTSSIDAAAGLGQKTPEESSCPDDHIPELQIRVFGGFDACLDGVPIDSAYSRQRRVQALMSILALNPGQELYSDYLADSIWPLSTLDKKRHCFYNLWYISTRAVYRGKREDNPYFERRQRTCRLLESHLHTDVQDVERACEDLMQRDLDPAGAMEAYRRLQVAYRGDLLPGETENPIIIRARSDWRDRVSGALSAATQSMMERGDDRTALWLATAACRVNGTREDVVRLRMELFSRMGMQAYAVRAYTELEDALKDQVGVAPSPQSVQMMRQVVDASGLGLTYQPRKSRRRGYAYPNERVGKAGKADFAAGEVLPVQVDLPVGPM